MLSSRNQNSKNKNVDGVDKNFKLVILHCILCSSSKRTAEKRELYFLRELYFRSMFTSELEIPYHAKNMKGECDS